MRFTWRPETQRFLFLLAFTTTHLRRIVIQLFLRLLLLFHALSRITLMPRAMRRAGRPRLNIAAIATACAARRVHL